MAGMYTYQNVATSKGLDDNGETSSGNPVVASTFNDVDANQQWDLQQLNATYWTLQGSEALYLDGANSPPQTTTYNSTNWGQHWILTASSPYYTLRCRTNSQYLTNASGSTMSMVTIGTPGNAQKWDMQEASDPGRKAGASGSGKAKSPVKKSPGKKAASPAKASPKRGATKTISKKSPVKKSPAKKAAPKKVAAKKAAPKRAAPKKAAGKKKAVKKTK